MPQHEITVPEDATGFQARTTEESWITKVKYTNEDVIWGQPKSINQGRFAGTQPEQYAALFPNGASCYFVAIFTLQQGWKLRFDGEFPHSRYQSFTISNYLSNGNIGNGQFLRSDALVPDHASSNPFAPGANRNVMKRNYTLWIVQENTPEVLQPNTLYVDDSSIGGETRLAMRTYVVDQGYDGTGVVPLSKSDLGLPVVTLIKPDGTEVTGPQLLTELNVVKRREPILPAAPWRNLIKNSANPISAPAVPNPKAELFWNIQYNVFGAFYVNDPLLRVTRYPAVAEGGYANNPDTRYLAYNYSFEYGRILVITGKIPTFPHTHSGDSVAESNTEVKYFSITSGSGPISANGYMTVFDEKIPVDENGYYKAVVCWPWDRPSNATFEDGVVYLDPGVGEGYNVGDRCHFGSVYIHFQGPNPDWEYSPAKVSPPTQADPIQHESEVMGPYFPTAYYTTRAAFEASA